MDAPKETSQQVRKKIFQGRRAYLIGFPLLAGITFFGILGFALSVEKRIDKNVVLSAAIAATVFTWTGMMIVALFQWIFRQWRNLQRFLFGCACAATLIALFYAVENWRGKRAWEKCKRDLAAKGEVIDWAAYVPPPVPDDQNFFKAPRMQEWFVGRGSTDLSKRLSTFENGRGVVAVLTVASPAQNVAPGDADLILQYDEPVLKLADPAATIPAGASQSQAAIIPVIKMDDVALPDAIQHLWRQANLNYPLDAKVSEQQRGQTGEPLMVSLRWENVTARQALLALLKNYGLRLVDDPTSRVARIERIPSSGPVVEVNPAVRERLNELIAARQQTSNSVKLKLKGTRNFALVVEPTISYAPARVVVRTDAPMSADEIRKFISTTPPTSVRVETIDKSTFKILVSSPVYSAADFLAWSDQFQPDFDALRQALDRPYARMDGGYQDIRSLPIPNFVSVRVVAQTLADRTKCHLLLGRPEAALRDLTLIHDLCRLLRAAPTGQPTTLVSAMIDTAVTGIYLDVVADGIRLQAWREPQFVALQSQLEQIDLLPRIADGFRGERMLVGLALEKAPAKVFVDQKMVFEGRSSTFWERWKDPTYAFLKLAPRGWIYQNRAHHARIMQTFIESYDQEKDLLVRAKLNQTMRETQELRKILPPYTFLGAFIIPNFSRANQTVAVNQTLANEGLIVCALERYRIARGQYPETLETLTPQFIRKLPHDLIGGKPLIYRRTDDGKFVLYSVGWNERDDGGESVLGGDQRPVPERGDWVWR